MEEAEEEKSSEETEPVSLEVLGRCYELGVQMAPALFHRSNLGSEQTESEMDATGLRLWSRCCRVLLEWLGQSDIVRGRSVVELGCGACAALSSVLIEEPFCAAKATATDGHERVVALAKRNARGRFNVEELRWGDDTKLKADIIVGSELMYYNTPVELLVQTVDSVLSKDGAAFFCHVLRDATLPMRMVHACRRHHLDIMDVTHMKEIEEEDIGDDPLLWKVKLYVVYRTSSRDDAFFYATLLQDARPFSETLDDEEDNDQSWLFPPLPARC